MNTMLLTVSSSPATCVTARHFHFKQKCSSFCSLAASLEKLCRCTVVIFAAGLVRASHRGRRGAAQRRGVDSRQSLITQQCVHRGVRGVAKVIGPAAARCRLQAHLPRTHAQRLRCKGELQPGTPPYQSLARGRMKC
jgi:hypothetical protein